MKKQISFLLAAVMLLSLVPFSPLSTLEPLTTLFAKAESSTDSQGVTYTLSDDGTYYIVSDFDNSTAEVTIPSTYNSLPVKEIGASAFEDCDGLTSVTIPDSVTTIGNSAFRVCLGLTSIDIPDSVTEIGKFAFQSSSLADVTIGNSVITISDYAFANCDRLKSLTIPDSVKTIGEYAFNWCISLGDVTIGNSVTTISANAFADCYYLTSVHIGDSVTTVDFLRGNLLMCDSLSVSAGNKVYYSENNCIIETESSTLVVGCKTSIIPDDGSVTAIGEEAFYRCSGLTSITIPDSVTTIGDFAFYWCSGITSITIPNSVTTIGYGAFSLCKNLTDIYCEASSKPEGWDEEWEGWGHNAVVYWGGVEGTRIDTNEAIGENVVTNIENANQTIRDIVQQLMPNKPLKPFGIHYKEYIKVDTSTTYSTLRSSATNSNLTFIQNEAQLASTSAVDEYIVQYIEPNGEYYITTDIPDDWSNNITAYYITEDGTLDAMPTEVDMVNKTAKGTFTRSGNFVFVDNGEEISDEPDSSESDSSDEVLHESSEPIEDTTSAPEKEESKPPVEDTTPGNITLGDINSNGEIDSLDYILLKRAYFGTFKLTETAQTAGDINGNGEIDSLDYILLKRAYFGTYEIK